MVTDHREVPEKIHFNPRWVSSFLWTRTMSSCIPCRVVNSTSQWAANQMLEVYSRKELLVNFITSHLGWSYGPRSLRQRNVLKSQPQAQPTTWSHNIAMVNATVRALLRPRPCPGGVKCYLHNPRWIGLLVMPILEVRKLRLRDITELHQAYVASQWRSQQMGRKPVGITGLLWFSVLAALILTWRAFNNSLCLVPPQTSSLEPLGDTWALG